MDLFQTIETRRSVRKYLPEPVPRAVIEKALQATLLAPNTSNLQPWEMYWVTNPTKKALLATACLSQSAAQTASDLVVFVARTETWRRNRKLLMEQASKFGDMPQHMKNYYTNLVPLFYSHGWFSILGLLKSILFAIFGLFRPVPRGPFSNSALTATLAKTVALGCENFMLAITAQGYSTCSMEGFDEQRVKAIFKLPHGASVVMVISVGKEKPDGIFGPRLRLDPSLFLDHF